VRGQALFDLCGSVAAARSVSLVRAGMVATPRLLLRRGRRARVDQMTVES